MAFSALDQVNRRQSMRTACDASVIMFHPSMGRIQVKARDLSDGGISIDMGNHISVPVGTELSVIIKRHTGTINEQAVPMRVMHAQDEGRILGLMFIR